MPNANTAQAIAAVPTLNIRGLGCGVPHKQAVMQYLDVIDPIAQEIGAVNIVVKNDCAIDPEIIAAGKIVFEAVHMQNTPGRTRRTERSASNSRLQNVITFGRSCL